MLSSKLPERKRPTHGVFMSSNAPTIVFLTVCTRCRQEWLTQPEIQRSLETVWKQADGWVVGHYLLMPNHVHLFCSPAKPEITLGQWVCHWKRAFSLLRIKGSGSWQRDYWDTRLRREENYRDKWLYVQMNPVRKGLATRPEDWPFQGILSTLRW